MLPPVMLLLISWLSESVPLSSLNLARHAENNPVPFGSGTVGCCAMRQGLVEEIPVIQEHINPADRRSSACPKKDDQ